MVRSRVASVPSAAGEPSAAEQMGTLHPDLTLSIAGREITVREYGFFEGLEVAHQARAFIASMHAMSSADGVLRYDRIRRLFGVHRDVVVAIAAKAAGVEPAWVLGLNRDDSEMFMSAWFGVNAGFFVHEVVMELREEQTQAAVAKLASTGVPSSPASPAPDSATSTASDDSPSAN